MSESNTVPGATVTFVFVVKIIQTTIATSLAGLPIPTMDWSATDAPRVLAKFKEVCTLLFNGPLAGITEERQENFLLLWVGEEGRELSVSWDLSNADIKKLAPYWERFDKFVKPKSNFRVARFKLRAARQAEGESVDKFVKRIRLIANECAYPAEQIDEHLIDTLIFGCTSESISQNSFRRMKVCLLMMYLILLGQRKPLVHSYKISRTRICMPMLYGYEHDTQQLSVNHTRKYRQSNRRLITRFVHVVNVVPFTTKMHVQQKVQNVSIVEN